MTARSARRIAWASWLVSTTLGTSAVVLGLLNVGTALPRSFQSVGWDLAFLAAFAASPTIGLLIVTRHRRNAVGWLLLTAGTGMAIWGFAREAAVFGAFTHPGAVPGLAYLAWVQAWVGFVTAFGTIPLVLLLFPTGSPPSKPWRIVILAVMGSMLLIGSQFAFVPGPLDAFPTLTNPFGIEALRFLNESNPGWLLFGLAGVASAASVVVRFRRSRGDERAQMKWFAFAAAAFGVVVGFFIGNEIGIVLLPAAFLLIFAATGVAILKYRLYEIDVVINRTLVYGALAAFITVVYVAIVVGVGATVGSSGKPNLALSILATAVVAVVFQPVRERVQRVANRLVYGQRSTPYEALATFSDRVAGTLAANEILPRMARMLADATGAASTAVWLVEGMHLRPAAAFPEAIVGEPIPLPKADLPAIDSTLALPVHHQEELLGAITLTKRPGERLTPTEEQLARDLASQAGLVLHNVRLAAELRTRIEELRVSRRRLVAAQDAARRRLERNIHDGAQQQLVALSVKTNLARQLGAKHPQAATPMIASLRADVARTLEELDELAHGVVPAALTELGLVEALRAQAPRAAVPVSVEANVSDDVPEDVATAVYFSILEALQNVAKYAEATRAIVRLRADAATLTLEVEDDGRGFDTSKTNYGTGLQGIADRLAAVGGSIDVTSSPGDGTTVTGIVPIRAPEPELEPVG